MRLELDQIIAARLVEQIDGEHWIASFQGKLLQVKNLTGSVFVVDQKILLQVIGLNPVRLATFNPSATKAEGRFRRLT